MKMPCLLMLKFNLIVYENFIGEPNFNLHANYCNVKPKIISHKFIYLVLRRSLN